MAVLDAIAREKERLPRGWGRFGKTLDRLNELCDPEETVLASCVGLHPEFQHQAITLAGTLLEMRKATNVILVATERRLLILATGMGGAARDHHELSYEGLELMEVKKKELTFRVPQNQIRFRGLAKQMVPGFLDALRRQGVAEAA